MTPYSSKNIIKTTVKRQDDTEIVYAAQKLNAHTIVKETIMIGKTFGTAIGAAIDAKSIGMGGMATTAFFEALYENLTEQQIEHIQQLLFGSVYLGDVDSSKKVDSDYWDEDDNAQDYYDVFFWLIKENFINFTMRNGMFQRHKEKLNQLLGANVTDEIMNVLNATDTDSNMQSENE